MTVTTPPPRERARETPPPAPGRAPTLLDSFNYAFEGIIHVLRTQRNLRIHFVIAIVVIAPEHTADLREAVVHGTLHLVGMDHETDDGEMLALQRELLSW